MHDAIDDVMIVAIYGAVLAMAFLFGYTMVGPIVEGIL